MVTILLATGVLASPSEPSNIETPPERTITIGKDGGFYAARQQIDPTDQLDFVIDLAPLLEEAERFVSISIAVAPAALLLGFSILTSGAVAPVTLTDRTIRIWFAVDPQSRALAQWSGQGTACRFEVTATTDSAPPRTWQKTAQITVAQK